MEPYFKGDVILNYEREERIALVADGCRISQEEAEAVVKRQEAEKGMEK